MLLRQRSLRQEGSRCCSSSVQFGAGAKTKELPGADQPEAREEAKRADQPVETAKPAPPVSQ